MRTISKNFLLSMMVLLMVVVIFQTYIVHDCAERLKIVKETTRQELFLELDSMAWEYEVHPNTKYVTGVKRYYKCDVIKKLIEQETNGL